MPNAPKISAKGRIIPARVPMGSETDRATASPGNRNPHPPQPETRGQPVRPYFGTGRPATDRTGPPPPASREPACSADSPHASAAGTPPANVSDAVVRQVSREQKRQCLKRARRAMKANPQTWRPQSTRAKLELLVRKAMRSAPRPAQRLVERIYPRFSPDYVTPLDDFIAGLRPSGNFRGRS